MESGRITTRSHALPVHPGVLVQCTVSAEFLPQAKANHCCQTRACTGHLHDCHFFATSIPSPIIHHHVVAQGCGRELLVANKILLAASAQWPPTLRTHRLIVAPLRANFVFRATHKLDWCITHCNLTHPVLQLLLHFLLRKAGFLRSVPLCERFHA